MQGGTPVPCGNVAELVEISQGKYENDLKSDSVKLKDIYKLGGPGQVVYVQPLCTF